jgi:glycosyltransferase involved in cell wall biosynthesis
MKILINTNVIKKNHRGMGVFAKNIIKKLIDDEQFTYIFVSSNDIDEDLYKMINNSRHIYVQINTPLPIFEQIIIPILIKKYKPDICWFPSNTFPFYKIKNVKYVTTIHDLIFLDKKIIPNSIYQKLGKYYRAFVVSNGIKNIDVITSVSFTALKEIYTYFNIKKSISEKQVLYNSINLNFKFDNNILDLLSLEKYKYIYTISGIAPHKNMFFLLKSFKNFNKLYPDYKLVVSGVPEKYHKKFSTENVIFTKFIKEEEKNSLIKNADIFVFASLKEGFGIPLIEAMALNENVLASDIEVFKEIGKNYITYFSPYNEDFLIEYFLQRRKQEKANSIMNERLNYIKRNYNLNITTEKLISIFKGLK